MFGYILRDRHFGDAVHNSKVDARMLLYLLVDRLAVDYGGGRHRDTDCFSGNELPSTSTKSVFSVLQLIEILGGEHLPLRK